MGSYQQIFFITNTTKQLVHFALLVSGKWKGQIIFFNAQTTDHGNLKYFKSLLLLILNIRYLIYKIIPLLKVSDHIVKVL